MINTNKVQKKILVDNPKRPELEGTDGGNVGTDIISPQEGASDDKNDEPLDYHLIPHQMGRSLCIKNISNKKTTRRREKEKKRKRKEKKKRKRKNQREIMTNYFLLQRTRLKNCNLEWPANFSSMMFSPRTCTTLFKMTLIH